MVLVVACWPAVDVVVARTVEPLVCTVVVFTGGIVVVGDAVTQLIGTFKNGVSSPLSPLRLMSTSSDLPQTVGHAPGMSTTIWSEPSLVPDCDFCAAPFTTAVRSEELYAATNFRPFYFEKGQRLDFADETFDYIFSEHFLHHLFLPDAVALLNECHRVLKPFGVVPTLVGEKRLAGYRRDAFQAPWAVYVHVEPLNLSDSSNDANNSPFGNLSAEEAREVVDSPGNPHGDSILRGREVANTGGPGLEADIPLFDPDRDARDALQAGA